MTSPLRDYSGPFNPDLQLEDLEHSLLACYARDIMLANHIHDRSALVQVVMNFGMEAQTEVACDEWMGSSPIYNARNRQLLNIHGDDVPTAFKCFQVDIGAPHNYLKFHYQVESSREGYFWTTACGPYNHVRRLTNADPDMETQICHHMEDPTFDATVMAVNPGMRCRAIFRPPHGEVPVGGPCRWRVAIEHEIGLVEDNPILAIVQGSRVANFQFDPITPDAQGLADYSGPFRPDFVLEDLAHNVLALQCKELALDVQLLNRACYTSIAERWGEDAILPIEIEQWRAFSPLVVHRLRKIFSIDGHGMDAILKVLQLNPFFTPEYMRLGLELIDDNHGRIWLEDCALLQEEQPRGILSLLSHHPATPGFDALASAVNGQVQVSNIDPAEIEGAVVAWELRIDPEAETAQASDLAGLVGTPDLMDLDNSAYQYDYE